MYNSIYSYLIKRMSYSNKFVSNYKTTMCVYWETGCPRQSTCVFAHSMEELRPRMCPHGARCRFDRRQRGFDASRRPCGFFHPGELITPQEVFKRATEFSVAKPVPIPGSQVKKIKTQLCPLWQSASCSSTCQYAHSKEELSPVMCQRGAKCYFDSRRPDFDPKRRPCEFCHPGEVISQDVLFARALAQLKQKMPADAPKFIVKLDIFDSDEEEEEEEEVAPAKMSIASTWGDDDEEVDYSAQLVFAPILRKSDADLTEVDMDLSE